MRAILRTVVEVGNSLRGIALTGPTGYNWNT